ncbi:hypothetical protein CKA34_29770 (plasmid) [Rhizobium sp. 11515TR]|nr:hypothetical protein CKA34_29770 [Rhizobium sp. 11515TR]
MSEDEWKRDYVKSRDFHRHMRSLLASRFHELGWKTQDIGKCSLACGTMRSHETEFEMIPRHVREGPSLLHVKQV